VAVIQSTNPKGCPFRLAFFSKTSVLVKKFRKPSQLLLIASFEFLKHHCRKKGTLQAFH